MYMYMHDITENKVDLIIALQVQNYKNILSGFLHEKVNNIVTYSIHVHIHVPVQCVYMYMYMHKCV